MKFERWQELSRALEAVAPQHWDEEQVRFAGTEAKRDWLKFGSVTQLADDLEAGNIVDPDTLIVAAQALRKLSEKTERAALGRKQMFYRDLQMMSETGNWLSYQLTDGSVSPDPARPKSDLYEEAAAKRGFKDVRAVYKAIRKFISHMGDDYSRY